MIGIDTNILVRYLTQDDPVQSPRATAVLERQLSRHTPGFVSVVTVAETAWVLARCYGVAGAALAAVIERLLQTDVLVIERAAQVHEAMTAERQARGQFADVLIAALGTHAGCIHTLTLDRKAARLPGFALA